MHVALKTKNIKHLKTCKQIHLDLDYEAFKCYTFIIYWLKAVG